MIRFSCHTENFPGYSLEDTFMIIAALDYPAVDVSVRQFFDQKELQEDPIGWGETVRKAAEKAGLELSELFLSETETEGCGLTPCDAGARSPAFEKAFSKLCSFSASAGFKSIMGSAGLAVKGVSEEENFLHAQQVLARQSEIAGSFGMAFNVEPYRKSILHTVQAAMEMVSRVPSLRYTMDFLHFELQNVPLEESLKLLPVSAHLHVRQGNAQEGKCEVSRGTIDYGRIAEEMCRIGWQGDIASEFWCSEELKKRGVCAAEENLILRSQLRKLLGIR